MKRTTRLRLTLPVLLLPFACVERDPTDPNAGDRPQLALSEIDGFHFVSPIGSGTSSAGFLGIVSPTVVICQWVSNACVGGTTLAEFTMTSGTGNTTTIRLSTDGSNVYQVNWPTSVTEDAVIDGAVYQVVVHVGGHVLGTADIALFENPGQAKKADVAAFAIQKGRTLPIKFGVTLAALESIEDAGGNVLVETFTTTGGLQTATLPGRAAFQVDGANIRIPGGGTSFTLLIAEKPVDENGECVNSYGGPNAGGCYVFETIPQGVEFLDGVGNPAGTAGVCPDENVTDEYQLAVDDDGIVTFPPPGAPLGFCDGGIDGIGLNRLPRMLRGLARLFLPTPVHATDLGITGLIRSFSTFFYAVPLTVEANPASPLPGGPFVPGQTLALSFRVMTTHNHDLTADPVAGVTVDFAASAGLVSAANAVSDGAGVVNVSWTLPGAGVGVHVLTASVAGTGAGALQFTATFGTSFVADFDVDPLEEPIASGTAVNHTYASVGITLTKLPAGVTALCGGNDVVYANDHGPADPWFSGAFGFGSGQNNVTVCAPPIASDFRESTFGVIEASFAYDVSTVCIDVAPTTPGGRGFLEAFDPEGASLARVTSAPGVRQTFCVSATGINAVRFGGDGDDFAIFDNLQVFFTPPPIPS